MPNRALVLGAAATLATSLGGHAAKAQPAELTKAEQAEIWKQGELSGWAEICGLDWQTISFRPMMSRWRRIGKSEQQLALISVLHGAAQGSVTAKTGSCTRQMRQAINAQLPFRG